MSPYVPLLQDPNEEEEEEDPQDDEEEEEDTVSAPIWHLDVFVNIPSLSIRQKHSDASPAVHAV